MNVKFELRIFQYQENMQTTVGAENYAIVRIELFTSRAPKSPFSRELTGSMKAWCGLWNKRT